MFVDKYLCGLFLLVSYRSELRVQMWTGTFLFNPIEINQSILNEYLYFLSKIEPNKLNKIVEREQGHHELNMT